MPGTLYLIPNTLGALDPAPHALSHILPDQVQDIASKLEYFVAENAKTARAFLKLVAQDHPLARPLQDIRIASPSARFGVPIARTLGNCLSHQNYARLFTTLGLARTKELLMTGRLMKADEMLASGYVAEVVAGEEDLFPRAQSLAETISANAPLTLEVSKRALRRVRDRLFPIEEDTDIIEACYLSEDFHEGVEAFLAKRKPSWKGR